MCTWLATRPAGTVVGCAPPASAPLYGLMLRKLGLCYSQLQSPEFDNLFRERLLGFIQESKINAVCLLAQEAVYYEDGSPWLNAGNAFVPNEYVLQLAHNHEEFIPAVSIHPARPDAIDELERCLEGGAAMMKCLPNCQNIDCSDDRFRSFWNRMAEAGLPLLAHTGGEHTLQVINAEYANLGNSPATIGMRRDRNCRARCHR